MKILVVDDDKEIVESISIFLKGEGYEVLKAYNGLDALEMLTENDVQLMLLDHDAQARWHKDIVEIAGNQEYTGDSDLRKIRGCR